MTGWRRTHSVRVKLTAGFIGAMMLVLAVYAAAVLAFVNRNLSNALDDSLRGDLQWAAAMADERPDGSLRWFDDDRNFGEDTPWLQVWSGGQLIYRSETAERNPLPATAALAVRPNRGIVAVAGSTAPVRVLTTATVLFNKPVVLQVAKSEGPMRRQLLQLLAFWALGLPLGVAAAGIGGYSLARRALAPIEEMTERARTITAENLHDRLPVRHSHDELGQLASVFNDTLGRLESSFEQTRRFTADVSHELRTPLTAMRSVGEVGLREHRTPDAYRHIIESMLEDVDRLTTLVDRLLTLSRAETAQTMLSREAIDLTTLAHDVVGQLGVLAEEKRQSLTVEAAGSPQGIGDRGVLRQSLINLVDNAVKYTPEGGAVRVRVWESPQAALIEVADNGPGIAPDMRGRIFDRYYRAGRSVSGVAGGTGLGLAIAKWAVEVSGGQLSLEPAAQGCTFRISLPKAGSSLTKLSESPRPALV
jgi:heavy metal sensor kinase